jgi:hypothetical protein
MTKNDLFTYLIFFFFIVFLAEMIILSVFHMNAVI